MSNINILIFNGPILGKFCIRDSTMFTLHGNICKKFFKILKKMLQRCKTRRHKKYLKIIEFLSINIQSCIKNEQKILGQKNLYQLSGFVMVVNTSFKPNKLFFKKNYSRKGKF